VVNGTGAYPGADLSTDPGKWLKISKKHDKQLTFIGRVGGSTLILIIDVNAIPRTQPNPVIICLSDSKYTRFLKG
jgi:hypothetical protein